MTNPILIITHNRSTPLTVIPRLLGSLGYDYVVHCTKTDGLPPAPQKFSGIIIMGGIMSVYDAPRLPWLEEEISWLATYAIPSGVPLFGICLGCQLLALITGGKVFHGEQGHDIRLATQKLVHADPIFGHELANCHTMRFHQDTYTLGPQALRLAEGHPHIEQAARFAPNMYGVQFHPEAIPDDWLDYTVGNYLKYKPELPHGQTFAQLKSQLTEHAPAVHQWLHAFLRRLLA